MKHHHFFFLALRPSGSNIILSNYFQHTGACHPHVARVIHGTYKEGHSVISPDWDFHSLRHTHATALVEAGVPLAVIQKRLGHAKIEMTEHYTDHVTETMERDFQSKLKSLYS